MASIFGIHYSLPALPQVLQAYHELANTGRPQLFHHYTSANGAIGILNSKTIWATNARYMNDAMELSYGLDAVRDVIRERYDAGGGPDRMWLSQAERVLTSMIASDLVYMACFCEAGDLLSQWRGYAPASGGMALTLDGELLSQRQDLLLVRVIYEPSDQRETVHRTLQAYASTVSAATTSDDDLALFRENGKLALALALLATSFKHPKFSEEREWRVLPLSPARVQFRAEEGWVRPYVEIPLTSEAMPSVPLREVTIGPSRHADLSRNAVKTLLHQESYNGVDVKLSSVPLR